MPTKIKSFNIFKIVIIFFSIYLIFSSSLLSQEGKKSKMPDYKITPHDILEIYVYPQTDLNIEELEVDANGYIFFSFLGHVEVGGSTVEEAAEKLRVLLEKDYLVDPRVVVRIKETKENVIILIGEVKNAGTYNYKLAGMTLMEAISDAGGFTNIARINGTRIIRVVDDEEKTLKIKVGNILKGKEKDVLLKPGDIIVVPESFF